jgi:hypothetical protein
MAMDISHALDEVTLRRSPRRRSPEKTTDSDNVMNEVLSGNRSPRRVSLERTNRSRSPIKKSLKKPTADCFVRGLFGPPLRNEDKDVTVTDNSSGAEPTRDSRYLEDPRAWKQTGMMANPADPPISADFARASALFEKPNEKKGGTGLFGQPSSPISHWPLHISSHNQSTSQSLGLFGQPTMSRSPPLTGPFSRSPFQLRTLFGQPSNAALTRGLFGVPLPRAPRRLVLSSFVDPLDEDIGSWNPEYQVSPPSPPPGILNMPYNASGEEELPDALIRTTTVTGMNVFSTPYLELEYISESLKIRTRGQKSKMWYTQALD